MKVETSLMLFIEYEQLPLPLPWVARSLRQWRLLLRVLLLPLLPPLRA